MEYEELRKNIVRKIKLKYWLGDNKSPFGAVECETILLDVLLFLNSDFKKPKSKEMVDNKIRELILFNVEKAVKNKTAPLVLPAWTVTDTVRYDIDYIYSKLSVYKLICLNDEKIDVSIIKLTQIGEEFCDSYIQEINY